MHTLIVAGIVGIKPNFVRFVAYLKGLLILVPDAQAPNTPEFRQPYAKNMLTLTVAP